MKDLIRLLQKSHKILFVITGAPKSNKWSFVQELYHYLKTDKEARGYFELVPTYTCDTKHQGDNRFIVVSEKQFATMKENDFLENDEDFLSTRYAASLSDIQTMIELGKYPVLYTSLDQAHLLREQWPKEEGVKDLLFVVFLETDQVTAGDVFGHFDFSLRRRPENEPLYVKALGKTFSSKILVGAN